MPCPLSEKLNYGPMDSAAKVELPLSLPASELDAFAEEVGCESGVCETEGPECVGSSKGESCSSGKVPSENGLALR